MESNRKRRGFLKAKLTPLYRAAKPGSATSVMPNQASATMTAPFSLWIHRDYNVSQPKQVSFFVPADKKRENLSQIDTFFGVAGDEAVDIKAATYISSVQERFKHERNNSEQVMLQETH
ncbi:hypothetical protein F3Y22_tig00110017pilonHSYRG00129 [Hibiscus syriacus]|uniref:Uncharacterized protein n=1 Tax=Hibiscus syriacus TaxID=106335 RepID=A0A6A3BMJ9_HIBSY|nr:uncharacterized protein LOC120212954 [Hibiscus syriacus]KAE8718186.1 hypothetical protein F3Y22_tig00110017pilonHSYRG00129 [Hibiscus syriacus]